ncbi:hypothetical protein DFP72DRAFT_1042043 [Ephemerocybe angulata]|uniref:Uncharacterized protein n=1 Tax=Ephemerocybe angulata TaxID=980116 RepID=A0A8H6I9M2_9AGAR|nr:hypothetical protein DFP72DRAFT_1042043 [Tulosesus angulatus]
MGSSHSARLHPKRRRKDDVSSVGKHGKSHCGRSCSAPSCLKANGALDALLAAWSEPPEVAVARSEEPRLVVIRVALRKDESSWDYEAETGFEPSNPIYQVGSAVEIPVNKEEDGLYGFEFGYTTPSISGASEILIRIKGLDNWEGQLISTSHLQDSAFFTEEIELTLDPKTGIALPELDPFDLAEEVSPSDVEAFASYMSGRRPRVHSHDKGEAAAFYAGVAKLAAHWHFWGAGVDAVRRLREQAGEDAARALFIRRSLTLNNSDVRSSVLAHMPGFNPEGEEEEEIIVDPCVWGDDKVDLVWSESEIEEGELSMEEMEMEFIETEVMEVVKREIHIYKTPKPNYNSSATSERKGM